MRSSPRGAARLIAFLLALSASACGTRPSSSQAEDAGQTVELDAANAAEDAGPALADAGPSPEDGGPSSADASAPPDAGPCVPASPAELNCSDGRDDDCNGLIDCADLACALPCDEGSRCSSSELCRRRLGVGGTVSGLEGTGLVLQNAGGDDLSISANGSFAFSTRLGVGRNYEVTVKSQPKSPAQTCMVSAGSGAVGLADVTDVRVTCGSPWFSVGGAVSGLVGSGLVLQNAGGDDLTVTGNGSFEFATLVPDGGAYSVTVRTQPTSPVQTCTVRSASGIAHSDVRDVAVDCGTPRYPLRVNVSGLAGSGLVLHDNAGDDLSISANGAFQFPTLIPAGASYSVAVKAQPAAPAQTCAFQGGSEVGTAGPSAPAVVLACTTNLYAVRGSVAGLAGTGLVLQDNGGEDLPISANGPFAFAARLQDGARYSVTVKSQPTSPGQSCVVSSGSGFVAAADATGVLVSCTTNTHSVGGTISGLYGPIVLQLNGGPGLALSQNGTFWFTNPIAEGATYAATVQFQPSRPAQTCTIGNATGTMGSANVFNLAVTCGTPAYYLSGQLLNATNATISIRNNGGDELKFDPHTSASISFRVPIPSGSTYAVTASPSGGGEPVGCAVQNGTGRIAYSDVSNVSVTCGTATFLARTPSRYIANLGGRAGADAKCAAALGANTSISCPHARALLSVGAEDSLKNMAANYSIPTSRSVVRADLSATIANSWNDLLSTSGLRASIDTMAYGANLWWSGSDTTGSANQTCNAWTSATNAYGGTLGRFNATALVQTATEDSWIWAGGVTCTDTNFLVCVCY